MSSLMLLSLAFRGVVVLHRALAVFHEAVDVRFFPQIVFMLKLLMHVIKQISTYYFTSFNIIFNWS